MKGLPLSSDLALPINAVTQKMAWIGVSGSGKTYGGTKLAELFWHAGAQFVALDPVGKWHGLRLGKHGKGAGIAVPVFGGLYGDVPLEPTGGALVADLIADRGISAVLDVSQFESDADKARFMAGFADRFFRRKKAAPSAVHVFFEECQEFVPQNPQPGEQMMLHYIHRMQKLGRNFGIGTSMMTQRPQETSKKALNQAQTLFVFRLAGSQERKAVKEWVSDKGLDQALIDELAKLPTGTAWCWSPEWLKVLRQVQIAAKETYDVSATPEVGAAVAAYHLTPIDLEKIKADMAATIEKAKAEDPQALRAELQRLHLELARARHPVQGKAVTVEKRVEVGVVKEQQLVRLEAALARAEKMLPALTEAAKVAAAATGELHELLRAAHRLNAGAHAPPKMGGGFACTAAPLLTHAGARQSHAYAAAADQRAEDNGLPAIQQRILNALRFLEPMNGLGSSRAQVAFMSGTTPSSSHFQNNIGALKTAGLLGYPADGQLQLTDAGRARASAVGVPTCTEELHAAVLGRLPGIQQRILRALLAAYPQQVARPQLAASCATTPTSSHFQNSISALKSLGVLEYPANGWLIASGKLYLEAHAQ